MAKWLEKEVVSSIDGIPPIEEWQSARCSACGKYHTTPYMYYFDEYKFCPNCGQAMDGKDEPQIEDGDDYLRGYQAGYYARGVLDKAGVEIHIDKPRGFTLNADSGSAYKQIKDESQTKNLFTDKYGDVWEWRGDAWYCISGQDEPQERSK